MSDSLPPTMTVAFHLAHPEHLTELVAMMKELQADDPWSCRFDERLAINAMDELLRNPSLGRAGPGILF